MIFSVVIFAALFVWLKVGIKADLLVFGKYKVEGLYIKLDKKLTLIADKITIPKSKAKPSFENIDHTFDKIKNLFTFFKYIELKKVIFENNQLNIIFTDDILYLTSKDYEIAGNIHRVGETLVAEVSLLHLKKKNIYLKGKLTYYLHTDILETEGSFDAYNIKGRFHAKKEKDSIDFSINSDAFTDLKTLIKTFKLDETVESWIVDRVEAQKYTLKVLKGTLNVKDNDLKVDFDTLYGEMVFYGVKILYQKGLDTVDAKSFTLTYKNNALYFDLIDPKYKERSLYGSKIAITGLGKKKTLLKLNLNIFTPLDDVVQEILKSYSLDIPVQYTDENALLNLKIDIPLGKDTQSEKSVFLVDVDVGEGTLTYDTIQLPLLKAKVRFDSRKKDSIIVDARFKKGTVRIDKTNLEIFGGMGYYKKNILTLENIQLKESWYDGIVNGVINIKTKKADLKFDVKELTIGGKDKVFVLKNKLLPLSIEYRKKVHVHIPSLGVKIMHKKSGLSIQVENIKKIKPYLKHIPIKVDGGNLEIIRVDANNYNITGTLQRKACFLYDNEDVCHTRVPFSAKVRKNNVDFYAFDKRIHYNLSKSRITIRDLNIDLEEFLALKKKQKKGKSKKLVILGKNSKIRYKKHTLVTDSYDIEVKSNGDVSAFGSLSGNIIEFSTKGKMLNLKALRVTDTMLRPLINFQGLQKGRYTVKLSGNLDKEMKGEIIIEGGTMSDFKAYNNTLALINAIPALATLSSPGFSQKGFKITEGVAEYRKIGDSVIFDSIYVKGKSATIVGRGRLDLGKKTINMDLAIHTARELGKIVGNLPLLGYILMGKDKSYTIGLKISGSLDKPVVKTSAAKDILSLPLQLIKRTLESPAHIINK